MIRAYSIPDVRQAEAAAMADLAPGELMMRAASGLAAVAEVRLEERKGRNVVAFVGGGDNGGDALYAAQLLSEQGFPCAAILFATDGRAGTHAEGLAAAESAGVLVLTPGEDAVLAAAEADLVLDAITGIGGHPGLREGIGGYLDALPDDAYVLAVDLASGLDPNGLTAVTDSVFADETVSFGCLKPVHLLPAGATATGRLTEVDIGLDIGLDIEDQITIRPAVERLDWDDAAALWPVPRPNDDKYRRGVLGVVAGGELYPGAAVLSVTAAVEAGVGMARYVGTPTPTHLVRAAVPEAVIGDGRVQAWVIGPGFDPTAEGAAHDEQLAVAKAALDGDLPVLLDAGGIDLLDPVKGRGHAPTLITPHAGELARLIGRIRGVEPERAEIEEQSLANAQFVAVRLGVTVLLKGATTLVVDPDPETPVRAQADAPAWAATAGSGDVLAGLAGMLLASGLDPRDAGSLGALVHGVAVDRASRGGPVRALRLAHELAPTIAHLLSRAS